MKLALIRVVLLAVALASLLPACAQSDSAVTRANFCVVTGEVQPDGKVSISCNVPTTKLDIPSKLSPSMDTSKPYVTSVSLLMQMTKTQILPWTMVARGEEVLTSDHFTLQSSRLDDVLEHYMSGSLLLWRATAKYQEVSPALFKGFQRFDVSQCANQLFVEEEVTAIKSNCDSTRQYFKPIGRQDVFYECIRPFRSEHGYPLDRWCVSVAEINPNLLVVYMLKRSALESGDWIDIDQRLRVFFQAMLVKE